MTFDTVESADEAVAQLNGSSVEGIKLEVEIARKQKGTHHSRLPFEPGAQVGVGTLSTPLYTAEW